MSEASDELAEAENEGAAGRRLLTRHPHLTDRAVFDLVNGLEVAGDLVRTRRAPPPVATRIWNAWTGRERQETWLIDQNLTASLSIAVDWLKVLERHQIRSDLSLARVVDFACDLRASADAEALRIDSELERLQDHFTILCRGISIRLEFLEADKAIEEQFALDREGRYVAYHGLASSVAILDTLLWGKVGAFVRGDAVSEEKQRLAESLARAMSDKVCNDCGAKADQLLTIEEMMAAIRPIEAEADRAALLYMADRGENAPLTEALIMQVSGDLGEYPPQRAGALPRVVTPRNFAFRLVKEALRRAAPAAEYLHYRSERRND